VSRTVAALACVAVMLVQTWWMGPAVVGLDVGLALAFALWTTRTCPVEPVLRLYPVVRAARQRLERW
jgi:hypothetical protein